MQNSDPYVMLVVQLVILVFASYAAFRDRKIRKPKRGDGISAEVTRGENSMAALYTMYGATVASCLVLIDNACGLEGNKVALIVVYFLCATYVYFFSTWFRNSVFFPLMQHVRKD